jgi:cobaltochelatase CobN
VGVLLYRSLLQAGDLAFMGATLQALRQQGLVPRALWVSSLREPVVQQAVADWFGSEGVQAVLCATGFASVRFEEAGLGAPLWERLGVPVLQVLSSTRPRQCWQDSSIGLGPLDLSLQVALPELDGRYAVFGRVTKGMDVIDKIEQGDKILRATVIEGGTLVKGEP